MEISLPGSSRNAVYPAPESSLLAEVQIISYLDKSSDKITLGYHRGHFFDYFPKAGDRHVGRQCCWRPARDDMTKKKALAASTTLSTCAAIHKSFLAILVLFV